MNENRIDDGWASNRKPGPSLLYSRGHVELATMLATPVAGALLLCENLRRLGCRREGWLVVLTVSAATACVVGIVAFVAKGERHPLMFLPVELVFLAGMYLVFEWRMRPECRGISPLAGRRELRGGMPQ